MMSDAVIERLNLWGDHCARIAWPLLWQSSLLIVGVFIADFFLRRKIRPAVRQALWFVVLVKLLLPPSFAIPTGIGWWLRPREVAPAKPKPASYIVTYGSFHAPGISRPEEAPSSFIPVLPPVRLSASARALLASAAISATLLIIMLVRWRHLRHQLRLSDSPPIWLQEIVGDARSRARCRRPVRLSLTDATISPALCGLFRPVILLPKALVKKLTPPQLRAVLLHELFHLRNGDVWINCFQSLLQIVFWWHPFLWLANARIRRIREEVVDDSVRLALAEEAETYAPTLLEVARLALARPLATLGLVGILESRHALKQRVDRLVNFPAPRRVGLSIISGAAILAFASVALPMGQAPPRNSTPAHREAPTIALAQNSDVSNLSQNDAKALGFDYYLGNVLIKNGSTATNSSERLLDSRGLDMQGGLPNFPGSKNAFFGEPGFGAVAGTALGLQPLTDNGWVEFNEATGMDRMTLMKTLQAEGITYETYRKQIRATATKRTFLSSGAASLSADSITVNRETGEIVAEGSVKLKMRDVPEIPLGGRFHGNITNQLFAQNQPSAIGSSRLPQAGGGRRGIMNKLETIRLNHVAFDNLPLSEVVNYLQAEAKKRDPEGEGINFILNPNADLAGAAGPPAIDPATGLQVTPPQVEPADINGVAVRISPPLEDVRMLDVLDAITKVADKRIRYSIEDYGISFRLAGKEPVLFTRVIKVDPNAFAQGLESVVGFSVGNFQTGGQGGGGQQGNSSRVAVPRVQFAPNGIRGQGGAQGGAGGISDVTRPITMTNQQVATQQAVKQFFANAGVDLTPPKNVFFNDRAGDLLVHATLNDLDIIEKAVVALNAFSDIDSASPALSATASVGNSPVVGNSSTRTVEVVKTKSPAGAAERSNQTANNKLLTRTIKLDVNNFFAGVQREANLPGQPSVSELWTAFCRLLHDAGVPSLPSEHIRIDERNGTLLVHATTENIEAIERMVQALSVPPAQISIKAKFVEIAKGDTQHFLSLLEDVRIRLPAIGVASSATTTGWDPTNALVEVITEEQFRDLLRAIEKRDGTDLLTEAGVTTLSGRQAQIQIADMKTILTKVNPKALVPPGVTSSNVFTTENVTLGPALDVIPVVADDGMTVSLDVTATIMGFVGYGGSAEAENVQVYLDGHPQSTKPPLPHFRVRQMHTVATVRDGQTLLLGNPMDAMLSYDKDGKGSAEPGAEKKDLLVFATITIVDPAGNPIHNPAGTSATPGRN